MIRTTRPAKIAFMTSIVLSLLLGTLLFFNIKARPLHSNFMQMGKDILQCVAKVQVHEQAYLIYRRDETLNEVKDEIGHLKKSVSRYEDRSLWQDRNTSFDAGILEAMNIYERLFDQLILYHRAAEKNLAEIGALEKSLLAIIFSKMNPERGIIALQEIRIVEKDYLLVRDRLETMERDSFQNMRKTAVANLLLWAQKDRRIEKLMEKDNVLFSQIIKNRDDLDNTLLALENEREKVRKMASTFLEDERRRLEVASRRAYFLCVILLAVWLTTGLAVVATKFVEKAQAGRH